jgi:hypothetical protein
MYGHVYICLLTFGKKIKNFQKIKNKTIQKMKNIKKLKKSINSKN